MRRRSFRTLLCVAGLIFGAALASGASAMARNGSATPVKPLQVEQLGPKNLLNLKGPKASPIAASTGSRLVTSKTLEVEEFGPKHLLSYELKADARG